MEGTIFNIQKFSIHDGPGIRTTIFLKGCPLHCLWCHNPEGMNPKIELIYYEDRCKRCGACILACKFGVLSMGENALELDRDKCTACGKCQEACNYGAIELAGKEASIQHIMDEVMKDWVFYKNSGGGVTISGGEPFMQWKFMLELVKALKAKGVHVAVDTSGYTLWRRIQEVASYTDLFLYDLKLIDNEKHLKYIGVDNTVILDNLMKLSESGAKIRLRIPLIKGVNDSPKDLDDTVEFIKCLRLEDIQILRYHSMGMEKYPRLNEEYQMQGDEVPEPVVVEEFAERLRALGNTVSIGG